MTNTEFLSYEKSRASLPLPRKFGASRFGVLDGVLLLGFMAAFMGLVFLLAR